MRESRRGCRDHASLWNRTIDTAAAAASVDHAAHAGLLDDLMARVAPCFARRETRLTCRDMVHGLLSELDDHNCWTLAEAAGHAEPVPDAAPAVPRPLR